MIGSNCICQASTSQEDINSDKIIEFMEKFSLGITKETVVVLDYSSVPESRKVKECLDMWKERGLHNSIFCILFTSNIAETFGQY